MSTKKVPLVVYVDGKRTVIGEAVVDLDSSGPYLDVTAKITDKAWSSKLSIDRLEGSMSLGPFTVYQKEKEE